MRLRFHVDSSNARSHLRPAFRRLHRRGWFSVCRAGAAQGRRAWRREVRWARKCCWPPQHLRAANRATPRPRPAPGHTNCAAQRTAVHLQHPQHPPAPGRTHEAVQRVAVHLDHVLLHAARRLRRRHGPAPRLLELLLVLWCACIVCVRACERACACACACVRALVTGGAVCSSCHRFQGLVRSQEPVLQHAPYALANPT